MEDLNLHIEFGGGAEMLFNKEKRHSVSLPGDSRPWTMKKLLVWVKDHLLTERPDLFLKGDTVRPGILVLVNESDWELLGQLDYELQDKDTVLFISTLHGG